MMFLIYIQHSLKAPSIITKLSRLYNNNRKRINRIFSINIFIKNNRQIICKITKIYYYIKYNL